MKEARERLKAIIREKSYVEGNFALVSAGTSSFFFDLKMTLLDPEGASLTAKLLLHRLAELKADAIGGLEIGACPIVSSVCALSFPDHKRLRSFYVRKEQKQRGTRKRIEGGPIVPGDRIVIVEDVTTTGGSVLEAVRVVKEIGCEVICILSIVDREQGAKENLAKEGLTLEALFSKRDF